MTREEVTICEECCFPLIDGHCLANCRLLREQADQISKLKELFLASEAGHEFEMVRLMKEENVALAHQLIIKNNENSDLIMENSELKEKLALAVASLIEIHDDCREILKMRVEAIESESDS